MRFGGLDSLEFAYQAKLSLYAFLGLNQILYYQLSWTLKKIILLEDDRASFICRHAETITFPSLLINHAYIHSISTTRFAPDFFAAGATAGFGGPEGLVLYMCTVIYEQRCCTTPQRGYYPTA